MTPASRVVSVSVLLSLAISGLAILAAPDLATPTARAGRWGESKLAELPDGGVGYVYAVDLPDGGSEVVATETAPCARRPVGVAVSLCRRLDGGDQGALNRYPSDTLTGAGCQPVACSLYAGEDAAEDEATHLARDRTRRAK